MYSATLLDHFEHPRNSGELPAATVRVRVENPVCADVLEVALLVIQGKIAEIRFKAKGCVPCVACASMMTELVKGKTLSTEELTVAEINERLGGLPAASSHAAQLAVDAFLEARTQAWNLQPCWLDPDRPSPKPLIVPERHYARRIVSLQPSITLTLAQLGALDKLVACTKYCAEVCPEVVDRKIPIAQDSWTAQTEQITKLNPDLVLASVPYQMESLSNILKAGVAVVCFSPRRLADVYADIGMMGRIVEKIEDAEELIFGMQCEIEICRMRASELRPKPRVYCEEWGKPLIQSQLWVKELIEIAGGTMIGEPGATTTPDAIRELDPDVIIAAWCGAGDRVPLKKIVKKRGWEETKAARKSRVFCINDEFLNTPATCLMRGMDAIAWALHPESFRKPEGIRQIDSES